MLPRTVAQRPDLSRARFSNGPTISGQAQTVSHLRARLFEPMLMKGCGWPREPPHLQNIGRRKEARSRRHVRMVSLAQHAYTNGGVSPATKFASGS
jgi:hypothetical protein